VDLAIIAILKTIFKRARPSHHKADFRFVGPDKHSFPSGHATRCWSILGTLSFLAGHSPGTTNAVSSFVVSTAKLQSGWLLGWGLTMCLGRVALGRHYVTDVMAGSLLGRFVIAPLALSLHASLFAAKS